MEFLKDPVAFIAGLLQNLSAALNLPPAVESILGTVIAVVVVASFGLVLVIPMIWVERKVAARFQDRLGPNRAGPYGLLQTFADMIKLITKENITPDGADKVPYNIAPVLSVVSVVMIWAVIPFSAIWIGSDLNVGVLYIAAVGSFGILSVLMAGWSSNNKYALLGAFRAVAQLVSYEVPLFMALLVPILLAGTMSVNGIVEAQSYGWFILAAPVPALIFFISSVAEIGRTPFDLLEAESEIVAGFHTEYTGMKFGMFFAGEFLHAFTISVLTAILFFGGWRGPGIEFSPLVGFFWLMAKGSAFYFLVMWIRTTLQRIRIDHMLAFNWKVLTPLSLVILMLTAVLDKVFAGDPLRVPVLLAANVVSLFVTLWLATSVSKRQQKDLQTFPTRPVAVPPASEAETSA